jgi:PKD repeat protein
MITVSDSSGCPMPAAAFTYSINGLNVMFVSSSTYTGGITYSWVFGDGGTSSLQSPSNSYSSDGNYLVCLTIVDSCGTDSVCQTIAVADSSVGIHNYWEGGSAIVYPNPTKDKLYINIPNSLNSMIAIYDGLGRLVSRIPIFLENQEINLESYVDGVYYYQLIGVDSDHLDFGRFIISR